MSWLTRTSDPLQGKWVIDPSDHSAIAEFGHVELEFKRGRLTYAIVLAKTRQIIQMTYGIDANMLVTDQPPHPKTERTRFHLDGGTLTLAFGGTEGRFIRQ